MTAQEIDFPFASQVFLIRRTRELKGEKSEETVCGITSRNPERARPHELLRHNREHWGIENKLHHTRDTTYNEDRSRIRKAKGARSLASLKNLAIGLYALEVFKPPGGRR